MRRKVVLKKIASNKISHIEGFNKLYRFRVSKARFIYISINLANHKVINYFLMIFFALPFPIALARIIPKKVFVKFDITKKDIFEVIEMAKGSSVEIISNEANISIYII